MKKIVFFVLFLVNFTIQKSNAQTISKIIVGIKDNVEVSEDLFKNIPDIINIKKIPNSHIVIIQTEQTHAHEIIYSIQNMSCVKFIEKSKREKFNSTDINIVDKLNNSDWYKEIDGDKIVSISPGRKVIIGLIDTGVDLENSIIQNHLYVNNREQPNDNIDNDHNGFIDDSMGWNFGDNNNNVQDGFGHGTEISNIIISLTKNIYILPIKINPGAADFFDTDALIESIYYAISMGAQVINLSISMQNKSFGVIQAIEDAYRRGIVIVTSAGNNYNQISFPATMNETIAVGSTYNNLRADFSPSGEELDVVAPGVNIKTISIGGDETYVSGTSFSAAMVSAECANVISMNPNFSNMEIKDIIQKGTTDLGEQGWDVEFGSGKINGKKLYSILTPKIILPNNPFYAFSRSYPVSVSIKIPITTPSFLYIAVETPDHNLFWLNPDGWHDLSEGINPFTQLYSRSMPEKIVLFGDKGTFPALDLTNIPAGLYKWYIGISDNTFSFLSPISCNYMLIF